MYEDMNELKLVYVKHYYETYTETPLSLSYITNEAKYVSCIRKFHVNFHRMISQYPFVPTTKNDVFCSYELWKIKFVFTKLIWNLIIVFLRD